MEPVSEYHLDSRMTVLDSLAITPSWSNNIEHIEHLLSRGWNSEKQEIKVVPITEGDRTLLEIDYQSTRGGGLTKTQWVFDPAKGYEIVRASSSSTYPNGNPMGRTEAVYDVNEISPGIWKAVGVEFSQTNLERNGAKHTGEKIVEIDNVKINTGTISNDMFELHGMGAKDGDLITDRTVIPEIDYEYGISPLFDETLDAMLNSTNIKPESVAENTKPNVEDNNVMPDLNETESTVPVNSTRDSAKPPGSGIIWWIIGVLISGIALGYILFKKNKSQTS
jgi:hypothetical protein